MTPNTILEPASRSADATDNDDAMTEGLVANGEAVAVIDDRPGGHLDAMIVPKGAAEPRRDGAKELMRGGWSDIDWPVLCWIGGIHIAALAAPFCFTWSGLLIAVVLAWVTGGLGVCLGYHRLLTHGSFGTFRPVRWFLPSLAASLEKGRR